MEEYFDVLQVIFSLIPINFVSKIVPSSMGRKGLLIHFLVSIIHVNIVELSLFLTLPKAASNPY